MAQKSMADWYDETYRKKAPAAAPPATPADVAIGTVEEAAACESAAGEAAFSGAETEAGGYQETVTEASDAQECAPVAGESTWFDSGAETGACAETCAPEGEPEPV